MTQIFWGNFSTLGFGKHFEYARISKKQVFIIRDVNVAPHDLKVRGYIGDG